MAAAVSHSCSLTQPLPNLAPPTPLHPSRCTHADGDAGGSHHQRLVCHRAAPPLGAAGCCSTWSGQHQLWHQLWQQLWRRPNVQQVRMRRLLMAPVLAASTGWHSAPQICMRALLLTQSVPANASGPMAAACTVEVTAAACMEGAMEGACTAVACMAGPAGEEPRMAQVRSADWLLGTAALGCEPSCWLCMLRWCGKLAAAEAVAKTSVSPHLPSYSGFHSCTCCCRLRQLWRGPIWRRHVWRRHVRAWPDGCVAAAAEMPDRRRIENLTFTFAHSQHCEMSDAACPPLAGPYNPNDPHGPPQPPSAWQAMLHAISGGHPAEACWQLAPRLFQAQFLSLLSFAVLFALHLDAGVVQFFGRLSFLVDENAHAVHFFISALLQLLDR